MRRTKGQLSFIDEIIVDNFAGKVNMPEWDEVIITNMAQFADYVAVRA